MKRKFCDFCDKEMQKNKQLTLKQLQDLNLSKGYDICTKCCAEKLSSELERNMN